MLTGLDEAPRVARAPTPISPSGTSPLSSTTSRRCSPPALAAWRRYERASTGLGQTVVVSGLHAMAEVACPMGAVDEMSFYRGSPIGGARSATGSTNAATARWLFLGALFSHFFYAALDALDLLGGGDMSDIGAAVQES